MKHFFYPFLLSTSFVLPSSFYAPSQPKEVHEDATVYVYGYEKIKAHDNMPVTYMYTTVIPITVDQDYKFARQGANALEARLKNYIVAEMGNVLYTRKTCSCLNYYKTKKEAADARQKEMASHREQGFDVMDTPFSFSFYYDWKEGQKK